MMELYLVDIQRKEDILDEDATIKADGILLNKNLIRGYSLNYYTALNYSDFMNEAVGKYVDVITSVYDVPDNYKPEDCEQLLHDRFKSIFTQIQSYSLPNGGEVLYTETMIDHSTSVWEYEGIWEYIIVLFDDIIKYVPGIYDNDDITNLRQFIFDGIVPKIHDIFNDEDGDYTFDPYAILKLYIMKLLFI